MISINLLIFLVLLTQVFLGFAWFYQLSFRKAFFSLLCRVLWLLPILLCFFPKQVVSNLPRTMQPQNIRVFIDDSKSMRTKSLEEKSAFLRSESLLKSLKTRCKKIACEIKKTYLSQTLSENYGDTVDLATSLKLWWGKSYKDPWLLITDGGDAQVNLAWKDKLSPPDKESKAFFSSSGEQVKPLVLAPKGEEHYNLWIEAVEAPPFSFQSMPTEVFVHLRREGSLLEEEILQIHALQGKSVLTSQNVTFPSGQDSMGTTLILPPFEVGQELITLHLLATNLEKDLSDNKVQVALETMTDTVGLLHLLGSPSWDGRFVRRFLKAEPKFELVSFFILREPRDVQIGGYRDLSLVPFPVRRLFTEQLPQFSTVIMQNFTLFEFLQSEYQKNLVEYVKNGGGLLFFGGPKALTLRDLKNSPLKEILPFSLKTENSTEDLNLQVKTNTQTSKSQREPWYDENLKGQIHFAKPSSIQRKLASIFDDWLFLKGKNKSLGFINGAHHMENVHFKKEGHTPLLDIISEDGKRIPLAAASYPGRGRALWFFSDSLWRFAFAKEGNRTRTFHFRFLQAAMSWLLRDTIRKPLRISSFQLRKKAKDQLMWQFFLEGPAAKYFSLQSDWQISVCDKEIDHPLIVVKRYGDEKVLLQGKRSDFQVKEGRCHVEVYGKHQAFGSVIARNVQSIPILLNESELLASWPRVENLAKVMSADLLPFDDKTEKKVLNWLDKVSVYGGVQLNQRQQVSQDYFWITKEWYFWLLMLFMPLEVLIRRYSVLELQRVLKSLKTLILSLRRKLLAFKK